MDESIEQREVRELSTWWASFDPATCVIECFEFACGALFFGRARSMYCPDCLRKHHNTTQRRRRRRQRENAPPPPVRMATCSRCRVVFERKRNGPEPRFCPDCYRERRNERKRRKRAAAGPAPPVVVAWRCEACGKAETRERRRGGQPKYCAGCLPGVVRAQLREAARRRRRKAKTIGALAEEMMSERTCPCGRPTVTLYHQHCAVCIRTARPNVDMRNGYDLFKAGTSDPPTSQTPEGKDKFDG